MATQYPGPAANQFGAERPKLACPRHSTLRTATNRKRRGVLLGVDNTFATPVLTRPLQLGADIVMHSATKYLGGHSDLLGGALVVRDKPLYDKLYFLQNATGAVPSPFDCWLTMRGLKTLELRMQRHQENATAIAHALHGHPLVRQVYFPGLPSHPGHEIARRQHAEVILKTVDFDDARNVDIAYSPVPDMFSRHACSLYCIP